MLTTVKGIVVSETPFKESSKILNIYTKEFGIIGVMSKGCKNMKSPLRVVSQKLSYAEGNRHGRRNRDTRHRHSVRLPALRQESGH